MAGSDFVECAACGGVYQCVLADGLEYYHVCPPSRILDDGPDPKDATGAARLTRRVAIDNRRDENIAGLDAKGHPIIKSEGLGIAVVTDVAKLPQPQTAGELS